MTFSLRNVVQCRFQALVCQTYRKWQGVGNVSRSVSSNMGIFGKSNAERLQDAIRIQIMELHDSNYAHNASKWSRWQHDFGYARLKEKGAPHEVREYERILETAHQVIQTVLRHKGTVQDDRVIFLNKQKIGWIPRHIMLMVHDPAHTDDTFKLQMRISELTATLDRAELHSNVLDTGNWLETGYDNMNASNVRPFKTESKAEAFAYQKEGIDGVLRAASELITQVRAAGAVIDREGKISLDNRAVYDIPFSVWQLVLSRSKPIGGASRKSAAKKPVAKKSAAKTQIAKKPVAKTYAAKKHAAKKTALAKKANTRPQSGSRR